MTRFYVSMTWHDWPEGGSYGTVVEALCYADAETLCRAEMAAIEGNFFDGEDPAQQALDAYSHEWHLVDCFDLEEFIKEHAKV